MLGLLLLYSPRRGPVTVRILFIPSLCGIFVYRLVTSSEIILVFAVGLILAKCCRRSAVSFRNVGSFNISGWIL